MSFLTSEASMEPLLLLALDDDLLEADLLGDADPLGGFGITFLAGSGDFLSSEALE